MAQDKLEEQLGTLAQFFLIIWHQLYCVLGKKQLYANCDERSFNNFVQRVAETFGTYFRELRTLEFKMNEEKGAVVSEDIFESLKRLREVGVINIRKRRGYNQLDFSPEAEDLAIRTILTKWGPKRFGHGRFEELSQAFREITKTADELL